MSTTTTRLGLVQWVGVDSPSTIRTGNTTNMGILDNAVLVTSGTLAAIPAASKTGRRYYATDAGIELWDTGTTWIPTTPGPPIGSMMNWAAAGDPVDPDGVGRWLVADGRTISRTTYAKAFTRLGVTYGAGDGGTTFNIPDTRGRVVAGPDTGVGTGAANRLHAQTISAITNQNTLAGTGGADSETLATGEMPSHTHTASQASHSHTFSMQDDNKYAVDIANGIFAKVTGGTTTTSSATPTITVNAIGGGGAHNNAQPYLVINHIIRVL